MIHKFLLWLQERIKLWTQPASLPLPLTILADLPRSYSDLIAENAMLRLQLIILNRQAKKPVLTKRDRLWFVLLFDFAVLWKQSLHIVQPDTLLRWHRELFRFHWRRKSQGTPKISPETIDLIRKLANENVLWGADRIRGELIKLGISLSKRTIQKYMPKGKKSYPSSQSWATFLKNQGANIWACDFTVVYDWLFRPWHVFVVMELQTRRIVHIGVTNSPSDEWTAQQLREATPWDKGPKYLIHDRDGKFGPLFSAAAKNSGIEVVKTPPRTPQANGICERFMGSLPRECLDHILIQSDKHLLRVVKEYITYFNEDRSHQGIGQRIPSHKHAEGLPEWLVSELERFQRVQQRNWREARVDRQIRHFWSYHLRLWRYLCEERGVSQVADIKRQYLLDFVDKRLAGGYAASSINADLRYFHGFLRFLQEQGYSVPLALFYIPGLKQPDPLPKFLTDEQVRKLRDDLDGRVAQARDFRQRREALLDQAAFYLLWQSGLRVGEVEEMRLEDLDLEQRRFTVRQSKGLKDRTVFMTDTCVQVLQNYLAVRGPGPTDHVFLYRNQPLCKDLIAARIRAAGERTGVKVHPHRLRHTAATQLLNAGCRVTSIQKFLGHKELSTTMIYARVHDQTVADDYYAAMQQVEKRLDLLGEPENTHD